MESAPGQARIRWLTYWVAFGGWWHLAHCFDGLLSVVPLATQAQLLLLLWLQVPVFRGALRIFDFGELCLDRWALADSGEAPAANQRN